MSVRLRLAEFQARFLVLQLLAVVALFIYGAETLPGLAEWISIKSILVLAAPIGLAAAGQTFVILIGGVDLSVSGMIVASALAVTTLKLQYHWSFGLALVVAVVGTGLLGGIAGYLCHRLGIQPLIVTLAMGTIALGIVQTRTGGSFSGGAPNWLTNLANPTKSTFGISFPPYASIWLIVAVLLTLFLHRTVPGRRLLATGSNQTAAEYSLINTRRTWTIAFAGSAIGAALVGVMVAGADGSIDSTSGDPYLFGSIVAVIVGGTVFGGPGDYIRTVLGALFVTVLNVVLIGHGVNQAWQDIAYGAVILLAVSIYGKEGRVRDAV